MNDTVVNVHNNVSDDMWFSKNSKTYLQVQGNDSEAIEAILECANIVSSLHLCKENCSQDLEAYQLVILQEQKENPPYFCIWPFPAFWA